ncbi:MAG: phosphonoacetaldehyde hydrolase [Neisseriaceae bacterium]|nr:phosphonoacetaldehyde hydrolase [Neisseriaceae bacterium]MBP6860935.1 phosphonoacetaldehyde hydrolase [Neisseriaceae bacterium]
MAKITGVVFDWAGTTVDFGCMAPVQAFVDTFKRWQLAVTLDETRAPMGMAKRDHIETMLNMPRISELFTAAHGRAFTQADIDEMYQQFEAQLMASLSDYAAPKPHVLDTIKQLQANGLRIGSTTGYNAKMMAVVVAEAARQGYVPEHWCCADHVDGYGRPFPYMIFQNMQVLGLADVASVIKVGDTASDIAEGKAAGVWTVGIVEGSSEMGLSEQEWLACTEAEKAAHRQRTEAAYKAYGADFVINDFSGLTQIVDTLNQA